VTPSWWRLTKLLMAALVGFGVAGGAVLGIKVALDEVYHPTVPLQRAGAAGPLVVEPGSGDAVVYEPGAYVPEPLSGDDQADDDEADDDEADEDEAVADTVKTAKQRDGSPARSKARGVIATAVVEDSGQEATRSRDDAAPGDSGRHKSLSGRAAGERPVAARSRRLAAAPRRGRPAQQRSRTSRRRPPTGAGADSFDDDSFDDDSFDSDRDSERAAPPDGPPGFVTIDARPYATVFIDGERIGDTPLLNVRLPSGRHRVKAVTADGNNKRRTIVVLPGETEQLRFQFDR